MSEQSDRYEADYMHDGAPVLAREKHVMRKGMKVLAVVAAAVAASAPIIAFSVPPQLMALSALPLVGALGFGAMGFFMSVYRLVVTAKHVHVQMGLAGPKIPIESITSASVAEMRKGYRWGVRKELDGTWTYSAGLPRGISIRWQDEKGKAREALVAAEDPERLVAAIEKARAGVGGRPRVRVEVEETAEAEAALEPSEHEAKLP